jgi:hypothetical protein
MPEQPFTKPVEDSVPKSGDKVAVGEDLEFQRKWWRFERIIWSFFVLIIVCDLLGLFGSGWLAKAKRATPDKAFTLNYERVERTSTPSVMTLHFSQSAIEDGHIEVFVSDSIVKGLGAERVSPEPAVSAIGGDGITYEFSATQSPADVQFSLEPGYPGPHRFRIQLRGEPPIDASVFVVP